MELWYSIVELLPFEWAQSGGMYFMKNALLAVILMSPLFGLLSTMIVTNKMSFFSDALGHSGFTGIAIGALCGLANPLWFAAALAVVFAVLFSLVRRKSSFSSDTIIGVFSSTAVALGIFISTIGGRSFTKFNTYLIGDILSVSPTELLFLLVTLICVTVLWIFGINKLTLASVHPALAESRGIKVFVYETVFSAVIALVVTMAMTWVGLLVINSLLILPAASARNIAGNMRKYHLFSVLGALVCGLAGLLLSYYVGSSSGAAISLFLALWFCVTFVIGKRKE